MTPAQRAEREQAAAAANRAHLESKRTRHGARVNIPVKDGCVIVFSDAHFWPGYISNANRALLQLIPKLKPYAVINNGDSFDGASISRYPRIGWDTKPTVAEELAANTVRLAEIQKAAGDVFYTWNIGNHDARFETFLAQHAAQFEKVPGFTLKDHYPGWAPAWSTFIGDQAVVTHRFKSGKYAAFNNTLWAGRTIVTGHDHMLWEKPVTDLNGVRFGIDAGTLADIWGPQFVDYTEDNVVDWASGFPILHFRGGLFTGTEFVRAMPDGRTIFRGELLNV